LAAPGHVFDSQQFGVSFEYDYGPGDLYHRPVTSFSVTGLPPGVTLESYTGPLEPRQSEGEIAGWLMSGTPSAVGNYTITVTANGPGGSDTQSYPFQVKVGDPQPAAGQVVSGTAGEPLSFTLQAADPVNAPFGGFRTNKYGNDLYPGATDKWVIRNEFSQNWLPSGLTLNSSTGEITGTPSTDITKTATVAIVYSSDGWQGSEFVDISFAISLPEGGSFSYDLSGLVGGSTVTLSPITEYNFTGFTWSATGLPLGLSINSSTGIISGTINAKGTKTATVTVQKTGTSHSSQLDFDITPAAPEIIEPASIYFKYGVQNYVSAADVLKDPYERYSTFTDISITGLPSWATLHNPSGLFEQSTPTARGTSNTQMTVTGPTGSDSAPLSIVVGFGPPALLPGQVFTGKYGEPFLEFLVLIDPADRPALGFAVGTPKLPAGLSINTLIGRISGTPTSYGNSYALIFPEGGTTGDGGFEQVFFEISAGTPIITAGQTGSGKVGTAFSKTFTLTDSTNRPVTEWSATGLPSWASIDSATGAITGTPQDSGSTTITLTATGPGGSSSETATISIAAGAPIITPGQSFTGKVGDIFFQALSLDDASDRPATSWSATNLPAGLSINDSGEIFGTPSAAGLFSASITATGSGGTSEATSVGFTITGGAPIITPGQTASGKVGTAFSKTFTLADSANRPATSWSATGLPSWASINPTTGQITGTPQDVETATITLTATGPGGSDTEAATISIAIGAPLITAGQTLSGKVGDPLSATLAIEDALDRPAISWTATGLPTGISINASTGVISGTPSGIGSSTATITASNGAGNSAPTSVSVTISAGAPIITAGQTINGQVGSAISSSVGLTDSTNRPATSYLFAGLPSWAGTNSSTGLITGTPTAIGTTTISVTATGPGGTSQATNISLVISASGGGGGGGGGGGTTTRFMLAPNQQFTASLGVPFNETPVLLQGTVDTWYASGLPGWATINPATGAITGTPTFSGITAFNLSAIDSENNYSSAQATLAVTAWNVREIFVDVRERKILSVANSRYPLSKITLKRDDKIPFRIIFVDEETPFSIPQSFSVSVGLKKNFNDEEYLAFSPDISGTLDLSSEPIQELFLGGAESSTGFFEVKWEDGTSAFRTVKLAAEIQNSVIRGNDYAAAAYLGADASTTAASTAAQVRAIGAPIFGPAKSNSYTINISPGDKRISIAYPSALGDLTSVRYNQFNNSEVLDTFTKTSVQVSTSGNTASLYFVYTYTASIPFEDFATYTVTL
jgi:hypothetical protein